MHELSVCLALMSQVNRIAGEHGARRVDRIVLNIGPLSGIEPALLRKAFPLAAARTVAAEADLVIEEIPLRVECSICGKETEAAPNRLLCGACGDFRTRVTSGEEMTLASLELITAAESPSDSQRDSVGGPAR